MERNDTPASGAANPADAELLTELPSRKAFASAVGSPFRLSLPTGAPVELVLTDLQVLHTDPRFDQFSLTFHAPREVAPEQGLYRLVHPELGAMDILLVPIRRAGTGHDFEAVFNRRLDQQPI